MTEADPLASIRRKLIKKLSGFSGDVPAGVSSWNMAASRPAREEFPVPGLVLLALRNIMGFSWSGPGEKVAWSVYCMFDGVPLAFEHRKFGFTICYPTGAMVDLERVRGQLRSALNALEDWLEPYARQLADDGHATIVNRDKEFYCRYRFFRELADEEYAEAQVPPRRRKAPKRAAKKGQKGEAAKSVIRCLEDDLNHRLRHEHNGVFHSTAMVDAYFSRLEHLLVLLRAFTGKPLAKGELITLLAASWDEKLKMLVDVTSDRQTELLYSRLKRLKERVRNPFAHGGMENDRGSINIHMPGIGAVPANFSKIRESVRFNFIPIEADDHKSACDLFDQVDALLKNGNLDRPFRLVDAGVDAAFDPNSLTKYARVISGLDEDLEGFINWWWHEWERHANMDF
jgi:hypothetical protein